MALPDIKERLATLGFDSIASTPEEFGARIRADSEKWGKVIRRPTSRRRSSATLRALIGLRLQPIMAQWPAFETGRESSMDLSSRRRFLGAAAGAAALSVADTVQASRSRFPPAASW